MGDKYVGDWYRNSKHGQGTLYYSSGCVYTGDWINDKVEGQGKLVFPKKSG